MIVSLFFPPIEPGKEREFEESFAHRARVVDQMPGFLSLEVLRSIEGGGYAVLTRWRDRDSYESWLRSQAFTRGHGGRPYAEQHPVQAEVYEVLGP